MEHQRKLTRKEKRTPRSKADAMQKNDTGRIILWMRHWPGLIAAAFGFLLYAQTINYEYTLDDDAVIENNYIVHQGISATGTLLKTSYLAGSNSGQDVLYRPLSLIMFAAEWQLQPDSPALSHFINVLLYALTGLLLFRLLSRLFNNNILFSFLTTMLFMAHPLHTEVIANIKSRDEILAFLFSIIAIGSLLDYLTSNKSIKIIIAAGAFFLALLSKESAVTMLAVIPLLLFARCHLPLRKIGLYVIPFLIVSVLYFMIRNAVLQGFMHTGKISMLDNILAAAPDFSTRSATAIYVLGRYLLLLIFPVYLSYDYSYAAITLLDFADYRVWVSLLALLIISGYAAATISRKDTLAVAIIYFLITVSVASNLFVTIGTVMGERLLYAPSLAVCLLLAALPGRWLKGGDVATNPAIEQYPGDFLKKHSNILIMAAMLIALFSFKTISRSMVWKNNYSLALAGVQDVPNSSRAHYFLGGELTHVIAKDETDPLKRNAIYRQAIDELTKAVTIAPENAAVYTDIGLTYFAMNDTVNAIKYYDIALQHDRLDKRAMNNKGILLVKKDNKAAMALFAEAIRIDPHFADALKNLGNLYGFTGDLDNAMLYFNRSILYQHDRKALAETYRFMAMISEHRGDKVKAEYYNSQARENTQP